MDLDNAKTDLTNIQNRWRLLNHLRTVKSALDPRKNDPGVPDILAEIDTARQLIGLGSDDQAKKSVDKIDTDVARLKAPTASPAVVAYALARSHATKARITAEKATKSKQHQKLNWWDRQIGKLAHWWDLVRAEGTLWLVRPLLYWLLVVALCAIGLQQLYLKNATFGANPFNDYLGLIIWAMSADVASKTLSTLKSGS